MKQAIVALSTLTALPAAAQEAELFDCVMEPSTVIEVGSAEEGIIETTFVNRGDRVRTGDLLARLESRAEEAELNYVRARAEDASPVEIAQARVDVLKKSADRAQELSERQLMAEALVDQAVGDYQLALLELRSAEFEQRMAGMEVMRVEAELERRVVVSPIDAIVITRMLGTGEFVYSQAPVVQLARIDPIHVEVFLPTALYPDVQLGQTARVLPAEPVGGEYAAEVIVVDRVFDAASDTFGVRLALPNPDSLLPAGVDCRLQFP